MDTNDSRVVTNSLPSSYERETDLEIRNAIEVIELLLRWKKELEIIDQYDKEAA